MCACLQTPNTTNSLCGYKIVTGQPSDRLGEDFKELFIDFTERQGTCTHLVSTYIIFLSLLSYCFCSYPFMYMEMWTMDLGWGWEVCLQLVVNKFLLWEIVDWLWWRIQQRLPTGSWLRECQNTTRLCLLLKQMLPKLMWYADVDPWQNLIDVLDFLHVEYLKGVQFFHCCCICLVNVGLFCTLCFRTRTLLLAAGTWWVLFGCAESKETKCKHRITYLQQHTYSSPGKVTVQPMFAGCWR
jgi:hypothetical protein